MSLNISLAGAKLVSELKSTKIECKEVNQLTARILFIRQQESLDKEVADKILKCQNYPYNILLGENIRGNFDPLSRPIDNNLKSQFTHILSTVKEFRRIVPFQNVILDYENSLGPNLKGAPLHAKAKELLSTLKDDDHLFENLIRSYIYYKLGNQSQGDHYLRRIIISDPLEAIFQSNVDFFSEQKNYQLFLENVQKMVGEIKDNCQDETLFKIFLVAWSKLYSETEKKSFASEFELVNIEKEMKKLLKSNTYGIDLAPFWYFYVYEKDGIMPANTLLDQYLIRNPFENDFRPLMRFLPFNWPKDKSSIEKLILQLKIIEKLPYSRENAYLLEMYTLIKETMAEKLIPYLGPSSISAFNQKRKHYKALLENGISVHYSLFHLLQLGDTNEEYLWWVL